MNIVPLRYQATEYDCGTTAFLNAISYVSSFSEIPPIFLKVLYNIGLNECNKAGMLGWEGTSLDAMRYLAAWINKYSQRTGFPLKCTCYDSVDFRKGSVLLDELQKKNTAIVTMCLLWDDHYITLTDVDDEYIYLFDPYYWDKDYGEEGICRIDMPCKANRRLPIGFMETTRGKFYNLSVMKENIAIVFSWE